MSDGVAKEIRELSIGLTEALTTDHAEIAQFRHEMKEERERRKVERRRDRIFMSLVIVMLLFMVLTAFQSGLQRGRIEETTNVLNDCMVKNFSDCRVAQDRRLAKHLATAILCARQTTDIENCINQAITKDLEKNE